MLLVVFGSGNVQSGQSSSVYILCYHAFLDRRDSISFSNAQFRSQLLRLKKAGYRFLTYRDYRRGNYRGHKNILITDDDGNRSVYRAYFEVMKPLGIKPILGVYSAAISRTKYALTWKQLRTLRDEGCSIASHGFNHRFLNRKLYKSSKYLFMREIYRSKKDIEKNLNIKVDTFFYPYGAYFSTTLKEVKKAGYKYAFTIDPGAAGNIDKNPLLIKRFMMTKYNEKKFIASLERVGKSGYNSYIAKLSNKKKKAQSIAMNSPQKKKTKKVNAIKTKPKVIIATKQYVKGKNSSKEIRHGKVKGQKKISEGANEIIFLAPIITEENRREYESPGVYIEAGDIIKPFDSKDLGTTERERLEYSNREAGFWSRLRTGYFLLNQEFMKQKNREIEKTFNKMDRYLKDFK